jgi:hypothetical protein
MDLSYIEFSYKDIKEHIIWSWQEIQYAVNQNIISSENVIEHAIKILNEGILGYDIVLQLAILDDDEDISPYLRQLTMLEKVEDEEHIKAKWLYAILWSLYQRRNNYEDALEMVERIYSDFDYPQNIVSIIRYMPSEEGDLSGREFNEELLYKKWESYLNTEELKYK